MSPRPALTIVILLGVLSLLLACSGLGYYGQAIGGQLRLLHLRQPIDQLLYANDTDPRLKDQLREARQMVEFAHEVLKLPDTGSYSSYAETGADAVVWNVVAAPANSLQAKTWCFPVAGCVPYRGYFSEEKARKFAATLNRKGLDVAVSPATAYSTLGWFDDPLLDTMLRYPGYRLAGLIFHELAHQRLYIKGDAAFNEAFASTVEEAGIRQWLARYGEDPDVQQWQAYQERRRGFRALLSATRDELEALYAGQVEGPELQSRKAAIIAALRSRYTQLKTEWQGYSGYDRWFAQDLNNAHFALHATYDAGITAFSCLLEEQDHGFAAFYQVVAAIGAWPAEKRSAWLKRQSANAPDCVAADSVRP